MKRIGVIIVFALMTTVFAAAQKYAFVDSDYIRKNIPAFNKAQEQLDNLSKQWEKEVADGYAVVEQMYKSYQNDVMLLSQEMKVKREEAIIAREKEIKDLQNKYFGMEGDLFKKREELVLLLCVVQPVSKIPYKINYALNVCDIGIFASYNTFHDSDKLKNVDMVLFKIFCCCIHNCI